MWLAGALEGLSTAILLVLKIGLPIEDFLGKEIILAANVSSVSVEIAAFRLVEKRITEAISLLVVVTLSVCLSVCLSVTQSITHSLTFVRFR